MKSNAHDEQRVLQPLTKNSPSKPFSASANYVTADGSTSENWAVDNGKERRPPNHAFLGNVAPSFITRILMRRRRSLIVYVWGFSEEELRLPRRAGNEAPAVSISMSISSRFGNIVNRHGGDGATGTPQMFTYIHAGVRILTTCRTTFASRRVYGTSHRTVAFLHRLLSR